MNSGGETEKRAKLGIKSVSQSVSRKISDMAGVALSATGQTGLKADWQEHQSSVEPQW